MKKIMLILVLTLFSVTSQAYVKESPVPEDIQNLLDDSSVKVDYISETFTCDLKRVSEQQCDEMRARMTPIFKKLNNPSGYDFSRFKK